MNITKLWHFSKIINQEVLYQTQMSSAGSQKNILLERYDKNKWGIKHAGLIQSIVVSVFLFIGSLIPAFALLQLVSITKITPQNLQTIVFANSTAIAFYNITNFIFLFIFGLLSLIELLKGDFFAILRPLPVSNSDLRQLMLMTFLRMNFLQFTVMFLAFPLLTLIITQSLLIFIVTLLSNLLNIIFITFIIVIIGHVMESKVFTSNASRIQTFFRIAIVLVNMVVIFSISIFLRYIITAIQDLFQTNQISQANGIIINAVLSLIFFPFSGGYLITNTVLLSNSGFDPDSIEILSLASLVIISSIGFLILFIITVMIIRKSNTILNNLISEQSSDVTIKTESNITIQIETSTPIMAFMKKSLTIATRDFGTLIYLITPLLFPIFGLLFSFNSSSSAFGDPFLLLFFYIHIFPYSLNNGLSASEEELGGIISSLPYRERDLFRSRQLLMIIFMNIPMIIILLVTSYQNILLYLPEALNFIYLSILVSTAFLLSFSFLFGKVNFQYTLSRVNINNKTIKYIIQFSTIIVLIIVFFVFTTIILVYVPNIIFNQIISSFLAFLICYLTLEILMRKMFK